MFHTYSKQSVMRLSFVLIILSLTLVPALVMADPASAQTFERDGEDLLIEAPENESVEAVYVDVHDTNIEYDGHGVVGDSAEVNVTNPQHGDVNSVSLINASVTVEFYDDYQNNSKINETYEENGVDLHSISFESESPIWIGPEDRIRLPLDDEESTGIQNNDQVTLIDSGSSGIVSHNGNQIQLPQDDIINNYDGMDNVSIDAFATNLEGSITENPVEIGPEIRDDGENRIIWHPLVEDNEEYDIDLVGGQVISVETNQPGQITVTTSENTDPGVIQITDSSENILVNRDSENSVEFREHKHISATIFSDSNQIQLGQSLGGYPIQGSAYVVSSGEKIEFGSDEINSDGTLSYNSEINPDDRLLIESTSGVLLVELTAPEPDDDGVSGALGVLFSLVFLGSLFVAPIGIGGVVAIAYPTLVKKKPQKLDYLIAVLIAVSISLLVLLVIDRFSNISLFSISRPDAAQSVSILAIILSMVTTSVILGKWSKKKQNNSNKQPSGFNSSQSFGNQTFEATIIIEGFDALHNNEINIKLTPDKGPYGETKTQFQKRSTYQLKEELTYKVEAKGNNYNSSIATVSSQSPEAIIKLQAQTSVKTIDAHGNPIQGTTISSPRGTTTTDHNGKQTFQLDASQPIGSWELNHPKYETQSITVNLGSDNTFTMEPKTGEIEITTTVDGENASEIPIAVNPAPASDIINPSSETLMSSPAGNATLSKNIGRYEIESTLSNAHYQNDSTSVHVETGRTNHVNLNLTFTWKLNSNQQSKIKELRNGIDNLSDKRGQDTVIHRYYGSVIEELLDTIESIPNNGILFIDNSVEPDDVVDSLLTVGDRMIEVYSESLSTKRNVDLFAACVDMPDQTVRWNGTIELNEIVSRLESQESGTEPRQEVQQEFKHVEDVIERHRKDLAEVEPIKEVHKRSLELINETNNQNELNISAYGALIVLDAVEQSFEHTAIRERLSQTVF